MTPRSSALARLQQATTLGLVALAAAWAVAQWDSSPLKALAGAACIWFAYGLILALQCVMLRRISRTDTAPRPALAELVRAWWAELWMVQRVFFWRQPFRWDAIPDDVAAAPGRRGVVFIHGFVCNRGLWTPWLETMRGHGHPFIAVNLEPVFGSIDDYTPIIDAAVRDLTAASGLPPVLVCHSMGGVAARAWLRSARDASRVHRVITIASPHHGTWLGRLSHLRNARQMAMQSTWLAQLARDEDGALKPPFTCWYSHCDNIVFPASSATLPWADNRLVRGPAHVELAFHHEVLEESLRLALAM